MPSPVHSPVRRHTAEQLTLAQAPNVARTNRRASGTLDNRRGFSHSEFGPYAARATIG